MAKQRKRLQFGPFQNSGPGEKDMRETVPLRENRDFRRLYSCGKSAVNPYVAVYCRRNRRGESRLGITTGAKLGNAVKRNRIRRLIKESYRLHEAEIERGYDIVIAARVRGIGAAYDEIDCAICGCFERLHLKKKEK